jgi:hypothetical protein
MLPDPTLNIKVKQGRIYNQLPLKLDIYQENTESFANYVGQKPDIRINNTYGDIHLKISD